MPARGVRLCCSENGEAEHRESVGQLVFIGGAEDREEECEILRDFARLARAAYGFARRWPSTAKRVGFAEIAFGALSVAAVAAGVAFGF